jgi:hypothetical protein
VLRLGLAFSGRRLTAGQAVERTAGLGIDATVRRVDPAEGSEALGPAVEQDAQIAGARATYIRRTADQVGVTLR